MDVCHSEKKENISRPQNSIFDPGANWFRGKKILGANKKN
jgi:hypothetical protein